MNSEDIGIIRTIAIVFFCSSIMGLLYCVFSSNFLDSKEYFISSVISLLVIIFTKKK